MLKPAIINKIHMNKRGRPQLQIRKVGKSLVLYSKPKKQVSTLGAGLDRLERALSRMGLASRREAKELIKKGMVKVNNKTIRETGYGILFGKDKIDIVGSHIADRESILLYKPKGIETSKTTPQNNDIVGMYPEFNHLSPIGRLDKNSEGLIILSNDGTLASAITKIGSTVLKEYLVTTREDVSRASLTRMEDGITIDRVKTKPAKTLRVSRTSFQITLTEGKKHQIRRMCDACHLTVVSLIRIKIGHLVLGKMKSGEFKKLTSEDISLLKKITT